MLDFRVETFLCVCKHMNYTKAAEELNITQPGVSQHIKVLENYYGDKLFTYQNKELELTEVGRVLKDAMIAVKNDNLHLRGKITDNMMEKKTLRFGATLTIGEFFLPSKVIPFIKRQDNIRINLIIEDTKVLLQMLDNGEIDFAIVEGYFQKSEYEFLTVSREAYIPVCGMDYPKEQTESFPELLSHNLIVREDGSGTKEILLRYLSDRGLSLKDFNSISTINSIHVMKEFLLQNCGISFLYEVAVKKELKEGKLRKINLPDFPLYHEFNYIWRKNSIFKEYYQTLFKDIFRNQ